jgi:hypothetical protein
MSDADTRKPRPLNDGYGPMKKGYTPTKVQGGYVPTGSSISAKPPTGGSGVKPAKK